MSKIYFNDINQELRKLGLFREASTLTYHLEKILARITDDEIKQLEEVIESNIIDYFDRELYKKVEELKDLYKYEGYVDDNGYWCSKYERYFEFEKDGGMFANEFEIRADFDIEERDFYDDYETLEWLLKIGDFDFENVRAMDFEVMAVQALIYIKELIKSPNEIIHLSNAYLALRASEKLSTEFEMKGELLAAEQKVRNSITEKAIKVRHLESNKVKAMVIQKWHKYKQQKEEQGKKASKTDFAKRIYDELQKAHKQDPNKNKIYSLKTIRNNWLQGID
ncbi:hypothetical protein [Mannheimia indoligenes]|uniref:hypothetical protein n=1 Tax=Mannheimia indoligenes TaxID=3103145 RepID=UPI002FE521C0